MHKSITAIAVAVLIFTQGHAPVFAAADNGLGMALMFAVVNADGTLARGSGVRSSHRLTGTGTYEVIFDRDLTACAFAGTIGPASAGSALGQINVANRGGNPAGVFVDTNDATGTAFDRPFHLLVYCAE